MILRTLTMFGFKSFADKTKIEFGEGTTAVIGPNGCGKSNVVDAIRWVFGEQKPSMLRSSSMQDVIFSGTQKRQPLNMAEVTLTIENTRGVLPIEYAEVAITRRMHRSGEGEYLINRVPCRLRDIQNLFLDTGVGSNMYTTIENSMINAILSDKAEDRRVLFEEAAGIGKYRQRIRESQRKLEQTRQDLLRINDRVEEKGRLVRMLARMVEKAKRYKRYRDDLMGLEVAFERRHYQALAEAIAQRAARIEEIGKAIDTVRASAAAAEARAEEIEIAKIKKEEELQEASRRVAEVAERIREIDHEISMGAERTLMLKENVARFEAEEESIRRQIGEKSELLARLETSAVEREAQVRDARRRLDEAAANISDFDLQFTARRAAENQLAQRLLDTVHRMGDMEKALGTVRANLSNAIDLCDRDEREIASLTQRLAEYGDAVDVCKQQLAAESEAHANRLKSREALLARIDEEERRYHELVEKEKRLEAHIDACAAQRRFLEGLDASFEGYESGVKALLTGNLTGIMGIVADLIRVSDPRMVEVIEKVLGTNVQTVVFRTNRDLQAALGFLNASDKGVARMISLEQLASTAVPAPAVAIDNTQPLRSFVHAAPECERLADHLFNHVLVSDTADIALNFPSMAQPGTVLVSRDGVISWSNGLIIAGRHTKEEVGILQRKKEIERCAAEIEKFQKDYDRVVRDKENSYITREEAKRALYEVDEKLNKGRQKQREQETNIKHYDMEMQNIRERLDVLQPELGTILSQRRQFEEEVRRYEGLLEQMREEHRLLEAEIHQAKEQVAAMERQRGEMADHQHNIELSITALSNRIEQERQSCERLKNDIAALKRQGEQKLDARKSALSQLQEAADRRLLLEQENERLNAIRAQLETDLAAVREHYNAMLAEIDEIRRKNKTILSAVEQQSNEKHALEVELTRDREQHRAVRERIFSAYEIDLESPPEGLPLIEGDDAAVLENIHMLKERLQRVGDVNMGALGEYETENKELEDLTKQRDDLQTAVEELERAIKKLNREAREKFVSTFEIIKENFSRIFTTLFEGGEAFLALEENMDPLEAPILINARPAGKKMRGTTLLSGGERALTAISLLFALYMVRPSAYCILDELDAPLDDANIERFLRLLNGFVTQTQFIIVTHNKRTMEAADILYGVTQEESGVSTIASVKLKDFEAAKAA